jgi:predicted kinase
MDSSVLLISGPAGAGKSTVADAWAHTSKQPCAHLQLDEFRQLLKSGYIDPRSDWDDQTQAQLDLARENASAVVKTSYVRIVT